VGVTPPLGRREAPGLPRRGRGTALDREVVAELVGERRAIDESPLDSLSPREREVLTLMAEGRTNNATKV
jgi:DNA-binding NarL/FixJ family response regulator